ncbi:hypothetical protein HK096_010902, partial [Nowakowskiella sp. JEL0078]
VYSNDYYSQCLQSTSSSSSSTTKTSSTTTGTKASTTSTVTTTKTTTTTVTSTKTTTSTGTSTKATTTTGTSTKASTTTGTSSKTTTTTKTTTTSAVTSSTAATGIPTGNCQAKTGANTAIPAKAIVVSQDGTGNYKTVTEAINSISSSNSAEVVIYIKAGTYTETVAISKNYVTLVGDGQCKTVITFNNNAANFSGSSYKAGTVIVTGTDFRAFHITFQNTAPWPISTNGQAPAIVTYGERNYFYDCGFVSGEDTVAIATGSA